MTRTEIAGGLWYWTAPHPAWKPDPEPESPADWPEDVGCVLAETAGGVPVLIDPLVDGDEGWVWLEERLAGRAPAVLPTIEYHGRSSVEVLERFGGSRDKPGDVSAFPLKGALETVFYLPDHRTLVPGDRLIGDGRGGLRMCPQSWLDLPLAKLRKELRQLLDLPVERVLVSHGEPVLAAAPAALRAALAGGG
jgi:hypothetical protein